MTKEELKEEASSTIRKMVSAHKKAPLRGTYNKFLGNWSTGKNDIIKAATAHLKLLNSVSQMFHGEDIISFEEETVEELPKVSINNF